MDSKPIGAATPWVGGAVTSGLLIALGVPMTSPTFWAGTLVAAGAYGLVCHFDDSDDEEDLTNWPKEA